MHEASAEQGCNAQASMSTQAADDVAANPAKHSPHVNLRGVERGTPIRSANRRTGALENGEKDSP